MVIIDFGDIKQHQEAYSVVCQMNFVVQVVVITPEYVLIGPKLNLSQSASSSTMEIFW